MTLSEKQMDVLAFPYSDYQTLICDGSVRSGKTVSMAIAFVTWIMANYSDCDFILLGNTVKAATRNVIRPIQQSAWLRERFAMTFNKQDGVLTIRRGSVENRIYVFGANHSESYAPIQGMTAAGCFVDEAALCNQEAFNQALARCSVPGAKFFFNCNPSYPKHWFREEWILKARELNALHLHFTMDDNPGLDEATRKRYETQYHGTFYDRYVRGLWVVAEGLVYQLDGVPYRIPRNEALGDGRGRWFVSCDYGITNPFAALLWRVTPSCAYVVDEYYFDSRREGRRKTDSEHYEALERLCRGRNVEEIVIDPSATSFKEEVARRGRFAYRDADNSVLDGISLADQMLHEGRIKVSEECSGLVSEFGLYRWDEKKTRDAVIKESDHALDAMRYMASTVLRYELRGYA